MKLLHTGMRHFTSIFFTATKQLQFTAKSLLLHSKTAYILNTEVLPAKRNDQTIFEFSHKWHVNHFWVEGQLCVKAKSNLLEVGIRAYFWNNGLKKMKRYNCAFESCRMVQLYGWILKLSHCDTSFKRKTQQTTFKIWHMEAITPCPPSKYWAGHSCTPTDSLTNHGLEHLRVIRAHPLGPVSFEVGSLFSFETKLTPHSVCCVLWELPKKIVKGSHCWHTNIWVTGSMARLWLIGIYF